MKLYSNEDITEGCICPEAWIWCGRVLPFNCFAPIGRVLMIRLPWWVRKTIGWHNAPVPYEVTCQLTFVMEQFVGPETYRWLWLPVENRDSQ